jgi:hypothetical protein
MILQKKVGGIFHGATAHQQTCIVELQDSVVALILSSPFAAGLGAEFECLCFIRSMLINGPGYLPLQSARTVAVRHQEIRCVAGCFARMYLFRVFKFPFSALSEYRHHFQAIYIHYSTCPNPRGGFASDIRSALKWIGHTGKLGDTNVDRDQRLSGSAPHVASWGHKALLHRGFSRLYPNIYFHASRSCFGPVNHWCCSPVGDERFLLDGGWQRFAKSNVHRITTRRGLLKL